MSSMENFPGNSKKVVGDKPEKNITKVITGEVVIRKKSVGRKFKELFFGGDFKTAARHIGANVLLPAFRNLMFETMIEGGKQVIYGDRGRGPSRREPEYRSRVSYNTIAGPMQRGPIRDPREPAYLPHQPPYMAKSNRYAFDEIIFPTRDECELVLEQMIEVINNFGFVSVADFYAMLEQPAPWTDNDYGWTYLNNVQIRQVREGHVIDLPQPEPMR